MVSIPGIITSMTKADALGPIIALEATVTGGRTIQAHKRGGKDEARERLIEESTGAIVWIGGVACLNYLGDKILEKVFKTGFDVGTDKVLRTPFDNFIKKYPHKNLSPKAIALIKGVKVLSSVLLGDAFIGLVVPPLNQRLTRNLRAKKEAEAQDKLILSDEQTKSVNPSFKGALEAINVFTNAIENTNTGKLLSTDAGLVSGRMYSARNKEERREIAIRDIGSIYFYMWAQSHVRSLLNFVETGKFGRLDPANAQSLDKMLNKVLETKGDMSVEEFRKIILGDVSKVTLPAEINFETGELSFFDKLLNKFMKIPKEPLQVVKVSELEGKFSDDIFARIKEMSKLQPQRVGESVITKQQIIDAINECEINRPEFLDRIFSDFTGGKINRKTGLYETGKSKNEFGFVSNKKLYDLKALMEDYVDDICKRAKDGKITKDILKKAKNRNITYSGLNFVAGFVVAATFLSTLIPKFQYWVTRKTTGKDLFPGVYEEDIQKHNA